MAKKVLKKKVQKKKATKKKTSKKKVSKQGTLINPIDNKSKSSVKAKKRDSSKMKKTARNSKSTTGNLAHQLTLPVSKTKSKTKRKFRKLSNVEHVRMRTGMWLGQNSKAVINKHFFIKQKNGNFIVEHKEIELIPAVWKCLDEACMNCIDEYRRNLVDSSLSNKEKMNKLIINLSDDLSTVSVEDNGRGIPMKNAEGVFLHLMYGENFDDLARREHVTGQNGVGISLVRMVSEFFLVKTYNGGKQYTKLFTPDDVFNRLIKSFKFDPETEEKTLLYYDEQGSMEGCPYLDPKQIAKARKLMKQNLMTEKITVNRTKRGTFVQFKLNSKYFSDLSVQFDLTLLRQYLQDLAMTNPGLNIFLKYKRKEELYKIKKGLEEIFANSANPYYKIKYVNNKTQTQIDLNAYVVMGQNKTLTWVNSNFASLGGSPIEYLENRICDEIRKKSAITSLEKKLKTAATRNDVRSCFHMYLDFRLLNPRFKSQDKSYLINDLNEELRHAVDRNLDKILRKTNLINEIKAQMERRTHLRALTDAQKGLRRAKRENIPKLIQPTGSESSDGRILFIAEGDSAIAGLRPARNPQLHGLFPLKGKPLNVNGMSLAKAMANEEMKNIVAILGLPINDKVKSINELKYDKVSIITDADFDGYAIRSLLLSFFYEYWPELFEMGFINITTSPLYEVDVQYSKEKETIFCLDDDDYEKLERSLKKRGGKITRKKRNKGLGESSIDAMCYAVNECMIEIKLDQKKLADKIQKLWFNKQQAHQRRNAISEYAGTIYDEN